MNLTFAEFAKLAKKYNVIPLYESLPADLDTPVTAFLKIKTGRFDFLFESVVGGEKWARYSFLGTNPVKVYQLSRGMIRVFDGKGWQIVQAVKRDPFDFLRQEFKGFRVWHDPGLPRFFGGAVGYLSYDLARYFEPVSLKNPRDLGDIPDFAFLLTDTVVIFDNLLQKMMVVSVVFLTHNTPLKKVYQKAQKNIRLIKQKLSKNLDRSQTSRRAKLISRRQSIPKKEFLERVQKVRQYIEAGDILQAVLSLRFDVTVTGVPSFELYRAIRRINPSPYLFYLNFGDLAVVGASPEVLVRLENGVIEVRPIAGTRKRGRTGARDAELEEELRNDPKERAEHVMLLDLGRNDVGRVAQTGSVNVEKKEVIEKYSHVMHLVSHVSGLLDPKNDVFDVIRAVFPAGTLSGAPKVRAMQIIEELEGAARGIYGGAVGYISYTGNADLAITIRTAVMKKNKITVQAGAGIVYNSQPELEYKECLNKAQAMLTAIEEIVVSR